MPGILLQHFRIGPGVPEVNNPDSFVLMSVGLYDVNQFEMFKYCDISDLASIGSSQFLVDSAETGICGKVGIVISESSVKPCGLNWPEFVIPV